MEKTYAQIWAEKKLEREIERTPDGHHLIIYDNELEKLTKLNSWRIILLPLLAGMALSFTLIYFTN